MNRRQDISRRDRPSVLERLGRTSYHAGPHFTDYADYPHEQNDDRGRPLARSISRSSGTSLIITKTDNRLTSRPEVFADSGKISRNRPLPLRTVQYLDSANYRQERRPHSQEPRRGDRYRPEHRSLGRQRSGQSVEESHRETKRSEDTGTSATTNEKASEELDKKEKAKTIVKETVISLEADEGEEDEIMRPDWGRDSEDEETVRSTEKTSSSQEKQEEGVKAAASAAVVENDDLPHPWQRILSSKGEIYYYNPETEQNVWDKPSADPNGKAKAAKFQEERISNRPYDDQERRRSYSIEERVRPENKRARYTEGGRSSRTEYSVTHARSRRTSPGSTPLVGPAVPIKKGPYHDERALRERDRRSHHHINGDMDAPVLTKESSERLDPVRPWPRLARERSPGSRLFHGRREVAILERNIPRNYDRLIGRRRRTYR
ncbi:hypothetical protein EC973_005465 [Apophysomyces ossiformis]|uniref:WW domain-containing protein n=1 Tax=Apophysomyces ossiformis TaxID=679940 RepID=A0A8H7BW82_9FUNG|nr:hypothetical protein EC973_005465 [Apophysomyces ossiformis]